MQGVGWYSIDPVWLAMYINFQREEKKGRRDVRGKWEGVCLYRFLQDEPICL